MSKATNMDSAPRDGTLVFLYRHPDMDGGPTCFLGRWNTEKMHWERDGKFMSRVYYWRPAKGVDK